MVTVTCPRTVLTRIGSKLISKLKVSVSSNILSSTIETSNGTLVTPVGNVTLYGPES